MHFIPQDTSPFLILWYLFLGFFAVVIVVNLVCLLISRILTYKTNALIKKHEATGLSIKRGGRLL